MLFRLVAIPVVIRIGSRPFEIYAIVPVAPDNQKESDHGTRLELVCSKLAGVSCGQDGVVDIREDQLLLNFFRRSGRS